GVRLYEQHGLSPGAETARENNQKTALQGSKMWLLHLARCDDELLPKGRVFSEELVPGAGRGRRRGRSPRPKGEPSRLRRVERAPRVAQWRLVDEWRGRGARG